MYFTHTDNSSFSKEFNSLLAEAVKWQLTSHKGIKIAKQHTHTGQWKTPKERIKLGVF